MRAVDAAVLDEQLGLFLSKEDTSLEQMSGSCTLFALHRCLQSSPFP